MLIVEPLEGLDLATLAGRKGVWFSTARMYETTRAIDAGRAVPEETLHPLLANPPNL